MAASATLQSFVATPMACAALRNSSLGLPSRSAMRIRCQAEKKQTPAEQPEAAAPSTIPTPPAPAISPPKPKVSTSFFDVLAFSGPAPERINGRLAMIGFVTAVGVELASGNDLVAQLANGGVPWFFYTAALLSAASLVPLFKGVTVQSKSGGLFTADAEMWNGRLAMLGLVALAATEYFKGGPLV